MIPPRIGVYENKKNTSPQLPIGKIICYAIIDLGTNVFPLKKLYEDLDVGHMLPCNTDMLSADSSTKKSFGRVNDVMIELHQIFVNVDFVVMDMESHSPYSITFQRHLFQKNYMCNH